MDPTIAINERVEVVCLFRDKVNVGQICQPYKMHYQNREIIFTKLGLRHPTAKGRRMIHVFDVSDGTNDYRLEFDAEGLTWTLVSTIEGTSL
jgi:hypothetical protein